MSLSQSQTPFSAPREAQPLSQPISVAVYDEYADARKAINYLAERLFPVANLAIVGTDLKTFEKVTGKLTWGRVLMGGAMNGLMWAFMFGILMWMFNPGLGLTNALTITVIGFGLIGMLIAAIQHRTRGRERSFTSSTKITATQYEILAEAEVADHARSLLSGGVAHPKREAMAVPQTAALGTRQPTSSAPVDHHSASEVHVAELPPPFGQHPLDAQMHTVGPTEDTDAQGAAQSPYGQYWGDPNVLEGIGKQPQSLMGQPTEGVPSAQDTANVGQQEAGQQEAGRPEAEHQAGHQAGHQKE